MISTGFYPKISLPTRFDSNNRTATLIDNIFTNVPDCSTLGTFTHSISDHQMIYTISNDAITDHKSRRVIEIEPSNATTLNRFLEELKETNITEKLNPNPFANPDTHFEIFIKTLSDVKQSIMPKKTVKFNIRKHKKIAMDNKKYHKVYQ